MTLSMTDEKKTKTKELSKDLLSCNRAYRLSTICMFSVDSMTLMTLQ